MVGITDVARVAGVSTATVSRVLNGTGTVSERLRQRVHQATEELAYVTSSTASSLASGRTRNVGVVVPVLNRWFFAGIVEGAQSALLERGYDLTLYNLRDGGEMRARIFDEMLRRKRVDGVVAVSLELTDMEVGSLLAVRKPVVGVGGPIPGVNTFELDNHAVAQLATEHLIALGHRTIAHLGNSPHVYTAFHQGEHRYEGYVTAMRAHGLEPIPNVFTGDFTVAGGYAAGKQMLGDPRHRPTAVFAATDEMAIGLILACRDLGLSVPGDVSVVGVDDHELAATFGLTTIAQFPERQGERAVLHLLDQLEDPDHVVTTPEVSRVDHALVVRSSTARPAS